MAGTAFNAANWTGYDEATVSNPSGALTDFTLLIDVSTLSSDFKSNVQSDGADIRITKGDGTTELAYDLIDWAYNAGAPTGWIRLLWSGSLASSGTQNVRVWAGFTGGTAVAYSASETYGSDNAYDSSWKGYWPLDEDPSGSAPQAIDRTSVGNDGTSTGAMTSGDLVASKVGNGLDFDGVNDGILMSFNDVTSYPFTLSAWLYNSGGECSVVCFGNSGTFNDCAAIRINSNQAAAFMYSAGFNPCAGGTIGSSAWAHVVFVCTNSTDRETFLNAASAATDTDADNMPSAVDFLSIGYYATSSPTYKAGRVDDVQIHSAARSGAWISEEYAQSNDQSTFWGTWSWTAAGGGSSIAPHANHYARIRRAA